MKKPLDHSFIIETVVLSVCYNNVVDEADVHSLCPFLHELRQALVVCAWTGTARRMVVYQGYLCGTLYQGFAQDAAYIGGGLVDAAAADAGFVDDAGRLVE